MQKTQDIVCWTCYNIIQYCFSYVLYGSAHKAKGELCMYDAKVKTKQIRQQFYQKECKKILLSYFIIFWLMFYLFWCGISAQIFLLWLILLCLVILRMILIGTKDFDWFFYSLDRETQDKIQTEFAKPHTILPLGIRSGEIHLLSDSLIFRCRGKLYLIPLEEIECIRMIKYRKVFVYGRCMVLILQNMKKYKIEFLGKQQKQVSHIEQWIKQKNSNVTLESEIEYF